MAINFSEEAAHDYIHQQGMEALVVDFPQLQQEKSEYKPDDEFELWKLKVLYGFVYMRKPYKEIPWSHRSGLIICAINPFNDNIYLSNRLDAEYQEDVSMLKVNEINNWFRAWEFIRACGFKSEEDA